MNLCYIRECDNSEECTAKKKLAKVDGTISDVGEDHDAEKFDDENCHDLNAEIDIHEPDNIETEYYESEYDTEGANSENIVEIDAFEISAMLKERLTSTENENEPMHEDDRSIGLRLSDK